MAPTYCADDASGQLQAPGLYLGEGVHHSPGHGAAMAAAATTSQALKKSSLRSRWLVLSLTCMVMTGSYYA